MRVRRPEGWIWRRWGTFWQSVPAACLDRHLSDLTCVRKLESIADDAPWYAKLSFSQPSRRFHRPVSTNASSDVAGDADMTPNVMAKGTLSTWMTVETRPIVDTSAI